MTLQAELKELDKQEALKLDHTLRNKFGFIQRPSITYFESSLTLIDQPTTMFYHGRAKDDILFIDATGSKVRQLKQYKKIFYYAAIIRHPFDCSPPMLVADSQLL